MNETRVSDDEARPTVEPATTPTTVVGEVVAAGTVTVRTRIGEYQLLGAVGQGGMGVVYRARHLSLGREAAVKLVRDDRSGPVARVRFLAEAEIVATLDHPHVVRVYEFAAHADPPFLAMEYLSGGTLADRLATKTPTDPRTAAALVAKIARGVAVAHDHGIVHRDLKPGNVLFDDRGEPKVADFGLAKRGTGSDLTRTGAVMGTPAYMSPEQTVGENKLVGPQADVWALGVVLHECLTGHRPFDAEDALVLCVMIQSRAASGPRSFAPGVPHDLERVCLKCLEKRPADRYPSAAELADDLDRFLKGEPVSVRAPGPVERAVKWVRRNRAAAATAAVVFAALAAGAGVSLWQAAVARTEAANARQARADEERHRQVAEKTVEFMRQVLAQGSATAQGANPKADLTVREAIDRAAARVGDDLRDEPLVEAEVRKTIGTVYFRLEAFAESAVQFERVLALRTATVGPDDPATWAAMNDLAEAYKKLKGRSAEAERLLEAALAAKRGRLGGDDPSTLKTMNNLGCLYRDGGRFEAAEPLLSEAYAARKRVLGPDADDTLKSANNFGVLRKRQGRHADAEPWFREAADGYARTVTPRHPSAILCGANLAENLYLQKKYEESAARYEAALAAVENLPPGELGALRKQLPGVLAKVYADWGKPDEAAKWRARAAGK